MAALRTELESYLNNLLDVGKFKDYGPNGVQIEGKPEVRKLVSGVTASHSFIEAAVAAQADAVLVHHGLFWRGYDGRITGWMKRRIELLLANQITLFAYHLPLDAHDELGNNAQFGAKLKLVADARFGEQDLGFIGNPLQPLTLAALSAMVNYRLGRPPVVVEGEPGRPLKRIAWCTGGAQGYFESAIAAGADAFLTGEISEPQAHLARETGVAFLACGHHATERFGAPALAAHVADKFGLEHQFIEIENPA
jgi:dinuclear metal center YbgI/SA1388 family protein